MVMRWRTCCPQRFGLFLTFRAPPLPCLSMCASFRPRTAVCAYAYARHASTHPVLLRDVCRTPSSVAAQRVQDPILCVAAWRVQDPLGHLYEVGTFAQVHTILTGEASDSGQILLLGHRRIRRTEMVGHVSAACTCTRTHRRAYGRANRQSHQAHVLLACLAW